MSKILKPSCALGFFSILYNHHHYSQNQIIDLLVSEHSFAVQYAVFSPARYGMLEYYAKEMGEDLSRFWLAGLAPIAKDSLVELKLWADRYEKKTMIDQARTINIDPGLVSLENCILATAKPYAHRVYLHSGIYADLTYQCRAGSFEDFPWTYPDYKLNAVKENFNQLRALLKCS